MDMTNGDGRFVGAADIQPEMGTDRNAVNRETLSRPPAKSAVDLHIDRLVLDGLTEIDATRLSELVESELARLLTVHGIPPTWARGARPPDPASAAIDLAPGASVATVARQIAQGIYRGMRR